MRRAGGAGQRDVVEPVLDVQAVLRPGAEAAAGHERCRLCADRPAGDRKWLDAASDFTQKLWQGGELAEALQLGTETLATARRVYGDEDDYTLDAMGRLAAVHSATGDDAAAAHVPAARRRVNGNDHEDDTLGAMSWVAATHHNVGNFVAPLPPTQEALDSTRRTLGSDHISTIIRTGNLGSVHLKMGNNELAMPLYRERLEISFAGVYSAASTPRPIKQRATWALHCMPTRLTRAPRHRCCVRPCRA